MAVAPDASVAIVHVSPAHVAAGPDVCVSDVSVAFAEGASVTETLNESDGPLLLTVSVYVASVPAMAVAGPDFAMLTSASTPMDVVALAVSFAGAGSGVAEEMVAVFVTGPVVSAGMFRTTSNVAVAPAANVAAVHAVDAHANAGPLVCVIETNVIPAGATSFTETADASDGPLFEAVIVQVVSVPATAVAGTDFVTDRSALVVMLLVAVDVWFAAFGSGVEALTSA